MPNSVSAKIINTGAVLLLIAMATFAFSSMLGDSVTMDEVAHLPAGYSYLSQRDMRLNPEHPPLIKDLAALPLLFLDINFPSDIPAWQKDINGQWDFGFKFFYGSGNPADKMIALGRIAPILILILGGYFVFRVAREFFNKKAAILALIFYAFSPEILAHGRLVTTDVGAMVGGFIATYCFLRFLKNPVRNNIIFAGIAFGLAELTKFSLILLVPFFAIIAAVWVIMRFFEGAEKNISGFFRLFWQYFIKIVAIFAIGFLIIGALYQFHVWNYPVELQVRDIRWQIQSHGLQDILARGASIPVIRGFAQYFLGLAMVFQRVSGGNTIYFLGQISNQAWQSYFPIVYLIKIPLALHVLTFLALAFSAFYVKQPFWVDTFRRFYWWLKNHFVEFSMALFIAIYWAVSLMGNLNLGVRHLLPTMPFVYLLVSQQIIKIWKFAGQQISGRRAMMIKSFVFSGLLAWYVVGSISVYPYYLAYFNELVGGPSGGYRYAVDSNLDWGQDLKRLTKWVGDKKIDKIKVGYFGGGDVKYYLGDKFEELRWGQKETGWVAVSATFLQAGRGEPRPGFTGATGQFRWLDAYTPVTAIGNSIFVYYIE